MLWGELTSKKFSEAKERLKVAVLPVGVIEGHGDHLPLFTDTLMAYEVSKRAVEKEDALLLPPVNYGVAKTLSYKEGTISIRHETAISLYEDILSEIVRNGITRIVVVNGHGGNIPALSIACQKVAYEKGATIVLLNWWLDLVEESRELLETEMGHAAEDETSEVLAVRPDLVDMGEAKPYFREVKYRFYSPDRGKLIFGHGVRGFPEKASREKGEAIIEEASEKLARIIRDLKEGRIPGLGEPSTS
mgnify:CR=1 FL=1